MVKSPLEKNLVVNEAVNYSYSDKNAIYNEYLLKKDLDSVNSLEEILNSSIQYTKDDELKLGLEIILKLISNENEFIKTYALGKIYFLIEDDYIKEIIIKELKNLLDNSNEDIIEKALDSLELIALEVYKFKIFEIYFNILTKLWEFLKFKLIKFSVINPLSDIISLMDNSEIRPTNDFYLHDDYNDVLGKFKFLNRLVGKIPYLDEIEIFNLENIKDEMLHYYHTQMLEFNKNAALKKLAMFYACTFREKGHLRRLIALLDDDEYNIQQIGIDALIEVSKVLLTHSKDKKFLSSFKAINKYTFPSN